LRFFAPAADFRPYARSRCATRSVLYWCGSPRLMARIFQEIEEIDHRWLIFTI
jgi:hypothetical protein